MTIPLLVFGPAAADLAAAGWVPPPDQTTGWWTAVPDVAASAAHEPHRPATRESSPGPTLFELPAASQPAPAASDSSRDVISAFLASDGYKRQRTAAGRSQFADQAIATALRVLLAGNGRAASDDVASALGQSGRPIGGAMSQLRRAFNVEGYPVLSLDADGRTVALDEPLWRQQFGL